MKHILNQIYLWSAITVGIIVLGAIIVTLIISSMYDAWETYSLTR